MSAALQREVFTTSRLAEFCTPDGLEKQTGHGAADWPVYVVKELLDNALDAAEDVGIAPSVSIVYSNDQVTVSDEGPGIAPDVVDRLCDLSSRTSSRSRYIGPTRGAQGQALSTLLVMPYALDPEEPGFVLIQSRGYIHSISLEVDKLTGEPRLARNSIQDPVVKNGTAVSVLWPQSASTTVERATNKILSLAHAYTLTNPHLSLLMSAGGKTSNDAATNPDWKKWRGTSAHWYGVESLGRLIASHIVKDRETGRIRPIREFLKEFEGLSSTEKQSRILDGLGLQYAPLTKLLAGDELDQEAVTSLLAAMKAETKPVLPKRLGPIGKAHIQEQFCELGFKYATAQGVDEQGYPYLIEGAFAVDDEPGRYLNAGINWSSTPSLSFRSTFDSSIEGVLVRQYCDQDAPVSIFLHLVHPRPHFTDLGKTKVQLPNLVWADLRAVVRKLTSDWEKQRLREIKNANALQRRRDMLEKKQNTKMSVKDAVYKHLPAAYAKASGGQFATSHQIGYQLRPLILPEIEKDTVDLQYVEQQVIPDFVAENPEITAGWVILYDDRGHGTEPHTNRTIGLGTRSVRSYCSGWHPPFITPCALSRPGVHTSGPEGRYGAILFCEKEGFTEFFERARLGERYDIFIMSTKGTSVTAAREYFEEATRLAAKWGGIPIIVLADFDYNGFEIRATTYLDTRRYQFLDKPNVIDIGLRLDQVKERELDSEPFVRGMKKAKMEANLRKYGATEEEIAFLCKREVRLQDKKVRTEGDRVELNALPTPDLLKLITDALDAHGVKKVIPEQKVLADLYQRAVEYQEMEKAFEEVKRKRLDEQGERSRPDTPDNLVQQVTDYLAENRTHDWEDAVWDIIRRRNGQAAMT